MSDATELHNKLAGQIVRSIVTPILESGGSRAAILVLTESVVAGVVEFCALKDDVAREEVLEALIEGARQRVEQLKRSAR